ncbi:AAA-like domain-containing protein [Pantanalinema sp. GBBB05]|uniref:AAA-like domain-containing protein n=1 Tax=Pantanalinema sp. GBBB05 TaxID=2604139 RepID=UPI001D60F5DB|nr:TIR domain-containing protein [Pantanalinema sp. GBBB05]
MDVREALELADRLIYQHTGKRLNDLEREVFIGSWEGRTYDEIYPLNPEYVEKSVGYKLWQKLSTVCGEKVTKKKFRGALERVVQRQSGDRSHSLLEKFSLAQSPTDSLPQQVFISYRNQEPDCTLANQLYQAITTAGHQAIITVPDAISNQEISIDRWLTQIYANLQQCDYFLLLLSPHAAVSEMVIEELRQVRLLQDSSNTRRPIVLPIRVGDLPNDRLNHDLRNYLQGIPLLDWYSPSDTEPVIQQVIACVTGQKQWERLKEGQGREIISSSSPLSPLPPPPAPTPVADPELPQGQVRLDSAFYVERSPYEAQCYREILQPGTLIRIKAPRQMGKTSLMSRILQQAREQGYATVPLSFQHADASVFANLNQFLQWFCSRVARKLRSPHAVDHYWSDTFGSKDNCTAYFEDCLLSESDTPLVLGLDEVDRIFQYPTIADDFFGLLRAWYEEAGYGDSGSGLWEKLRLVIVHSTEVYIPLDVNQSPFNVGLPIELSEFSPEQVLDLSERHRLNWQLSQVEQLMRIVGGHPYLIRLAFYHLAQQQLTLAELLAAAPTEAGIYGDHLRRHLWNLQQHPKLATALSWVVAADEPIELESVLAFKLHSLGLVQLHGNRVTSRFKLYRQYFSERLAQH